MFSVNSNFRTYFYLNNFIIFILIFKVIKVKTFIYHYLKPPFVGLDNPP